MGIAVDPLPHPSKTECDLLHQAGLLALGSTYSPHLPVLISDSGTKVGFVPQYSGGTAPDFHGIPFSIQA